MVIQQSRKSHVLIYREGVLLCSSPSMTAAGLIRTIRKQRKQGQGP